MREHITGEIEEIHGQLNMKDEENTPSLHSLPPGVVRFVDVQIYDVPAEDFPAGPFSVESTLETEEERNTEPPVQDGNQGEPSQVTQETTEKGTRARRRLYPFPLVLAVLCVLLAGILCVVYVLPLLALSATVTIIPTSTQTAMTRTVTIVSTNANATQQQVPGRLLDTITLSQAKTVPATGTGHQQAQAASGFITFYNALPTPQMIPAGELLTGADGVEAVILQQAVIPAGTLATNGQITVPAQAVNVGPQGNITANDMYGKCCRDNVFVSNGHFRGGLDARSFQMVTQQNINSAVTSTEASLDQGVQAALNQQVQPNETLVTPIPCISTVNPDHKAGEEASHVQVTVSETCTGEVYDTHALHDLLMRTMFKQAIGQLGKGYGLVGDIQTSVTKATLNRHQGTATLQVKVISAWTYQFNQAQQAQIKLALCGKSKEEATTLLLHMPGVQTVSISTRDGDALPMDIQRIHLNFVILDE